MFWGFFRPRLPVFSAETENSRTLSTTFSLVLHNTNMKKKANELFSLLIVLDMRHLLEKLEPEKGDTYDTKKFKNDDFFLTLRDLLRHHGI